MRALPAFLFAAAVTAAGSAFATAPAEGLWQTPVDGAQVEITSCGPAICGRLVTSGRIKADPDAKDIRNKDAALRDRPLKGLLMFSDFTGGPAEWKGKKLYNPSDGGTYSGTIKLVNPDTLKLTGCIVWPACATQIWHRVK
jgi:uncharacterized protein (DUF2147 family)